MKAIHIIKAAGGIACLSLALAANAQVTVTNGSSQAQPSAPHETVGEHFDDATVTTKVKSALATEKGLKALHIHVKTHNGMVRLTGSVPDASQKSLAAEATANVGGVKKVQNNLKVVAQ